MFDLEGVESSNSTLGAQLKQARLIYEHNHPEREREGVRATVEKLWTELEKTGLVPRKTECKDLADLTAKADKCCLARQTKLEKEGIKSFNPQNRKRKK